MSLSQRSPRVAVVERSGIGRLGRQAVLHRRAGAAEQLAPVIEASVVARGAAEHQPAAVHPVHARQRPLDAHRPVQPDDDAVGRLVVDAADPVRQLEGRQGRHGGSDLRQGLVGEAAEIEREVGEGRGRVGIEQGLDVEELGHDPSLAGPARRVRRGRCSALQRFCRNSPAAERRISRTRALAATGGRAFTRRGGSTMSRTIRLATAIVGVFAALAVATGAAFSGATVQIRRRRRPTGQHRPCRRRGVTRGAAPPTEAGGTGWVRWEVTTAAPSSARLDQIERIRFSSECPGVAHAMTFDIWADLALVRTAEIDFVGPVDVTLDRDDLDALGLGSFQQGAAMWGGAALVNIAPETRGRETTLLGTFGPGGPTDQGRCDVL